MKASSITAGMMACDNCGANTDREPSVLCDACSDCGHTTEIDALRALVDATISMMHAMAKQDGWEPNGAGPVAFMHWLRAERDAALTAAQQAMDREYAISCVRDDAEARVRDLEEALRKCRRALASTWPIGSPQDEACAAIAMAIGAAGQQAPTMDAETARTLAEEGRGLRRDLRKRIDKMHRLTPRCVVCQDASSFGCPTCRATPDPRDVVDVHSASWRDGFETAEAEQCFNCKALLAEARSLGLRIINAEHDEVSDEDTTAAERLVAGIDAYLAKSEAKKEGG